MSEIITRFPPSPTGYLHLGGARTALFNWLYARHTNGRFVLRFEDTDRERSTKESVDAIFEALEWLGIDWDEGPYYQSERTDVYKSYAEKLIESGHAYYCTCSPERLEEVRKKGMEADGNMKYDGLCREKGLKAQEGAVIRFKVPHSGATVIEDKVKGNIVFQNTDIEDFIIFRSDGSPMYNLAVVIDDITMNVNTIIRGDDHISNTPKQILLYKALGHPLPDFAHVPMVLGSDKTRLSKRHGAMSVTAYKEMGFLPEAMINFLVRLGWSHGDQEFFTVKELIEKFSLDSIGKSAGVFNPEKLTALNADHIQAKTPEELSELLIPFLNKRGIAAEKGEFIEKVIETLIKRSKTMDEMAEAALFYYKDIETYEEGGVKKFFNSDILDPLSFLVDELKPLADLSQKTQEGAFMAVMEKTGLKFGKVAQPVRLALTGKTASPGIFEIIEILGKEESIKRLEAAMAFIKNN